jgi:hypothetical protein
MEMHAVGLRVHSVRRALVDNSRLGRITAEAALRARWQISNLPGRAEVAAKLFIKRSKSSQDRAFGRFLLRDDKSSRAVSGPA